MHPLVTLLPQDKYFGLPAGPRCMPPPPPCLSLRIYFLLAFSNYLSELLGTWLGVSTIPLKRDMVLHHMLTMTLISVAYHVNLVRYGVMWMALFDLRCVGGKVRDHVDGVFDLRCGGGGTGSCGWRSSTSCGRGHVDGTL